MDPSMGDGAFSIFLQEPLQNGARPNLQRQMVCHELACCSSLSCGHVMQLAFHGHGDRPLQVPSLFQLHTMWWEPPSHSPCHTSNQ